MDFPIYNHFYLHIFVHIDCSVGNCGVVDFLVGNIHFSFFFSIVFTFLHSRNGRYGKEDSCNTTFFTTYFDWKIQVGSERWEKKREKFCTLVYMCVHPFFHWYIFVVNRRKKFYPISSPLPPPSSPLPLYLVVLVVLWTTALFRMLITWTPYDSLKAFSFSFVRICKWDCKRFCCSRSFETIK